MDPAASTWPHDFGMSRGSAQVDLSDAVQEAVRKEFQLLSANLQEAVCSEVKRSLEACWGQQQSPELPDRPSARPMPLKHYQDAEFKWMCESHEWTTKEAAHKRAASQLEPVASKAKLAELRSNAQGDSQRPPAQPDGEVVANGVPSARDTMSTADGDASDAVSEISISEQLPGRPRQDGSCQSADTGRSASAEDLESPKSRSKKMKRTWTQAENALAFHNSSRSQTLTDVKQEDGLQVLAQRIVKDARFEMASTALIIASAFHIGLQADVMARETLVDVPTHYHAADVIFLIMFTLELTFRIVAYRSRFFKVFGWGWHAFDTFLVALQLLEEILILIADSSLKSYVSGRLLRIVRVLRTVRTVRILHIMRFASDLQMLVSCLLRSSKAFIWSLGLIVLVLYIVGVYFTTAVTQARAQAGVGIKGLDDNFGNLPMTVLSLFQGLTGGMDWNDMTQPMMEHISPWMGLWWFLYIAFAQLLVMNVVAATFVESAIDRASKVRDMHKLAQASRLFKALDADHSGFISLDELDEHLESAEVQEFFASINVDISEAKALFDLIDADGSGCIEFTEFLSGCLRLQGPAKSMDMVVGLHHLNTGIDRIAARLGVQLKSGFQDEGVRRRV